MAWTSKKDVSLPAVSLMLSRYAFVCFSSPDLSRSLVWKTCVSMVDFCTGEFTLPFTWCLCLLSLNTSESMPAAPSISSKYSSVAQAGPAEYGNLFLNTSTSTTVAFCGCERNCFLGGRLTVVPLGWPMMPLLCCGILLTCWTLSAFGLGGFGSAISPFGCLPVWKAPSKPRFIWQACMPAEPSKILSPHQSLWTWPSRVPPSMSRRKTTVSKTDRESGWHCRVREPR
mmetsp:Transcript_35240/g.88813  ORF Transcript_35240/g.88813 Transcript_35240/m.88813 type:complete len:228 (+) Transcript_35240:442-1125(+)